MAFPELPGNLSTIFDMGTGPVGVWAVKVSIASSPPSGFTSDTIQLRSLSIASEPDGRSPYMTACFVAARAAEPRKVGVPGPAALQRRIVPAKWTVVHRERIDIGIY